MSPSTSPRPPGPRLLQVVHRKLEMVAGCVDASHHHLVLQDELSDDLGTLQLKRPVSAGNPRQHVDAVLPQGIQEIELQCSDARGLEDELHPFHAGPGRVARAST